MKTTVAYAALTAKTPLVPYSIERREPGPHEVLIDILYCGVCHSDIHQVRDEWGGSIFPMVPGHEIVGTVVKTGENVSNWKVGDTVGVGCFIDSCHECEACKDGEEQFCEAGMTPTYNGTLVSPKGGQPPLDPTSDEKDSQTAATERFKADKEAQSALAHTRILKDILADDYDAVFYIGGHGPLWDLAEDRGSVKLIETMYAQGKPVSAVCHAPGVFRHATAPSGLPLVQGKKVTGFSNSEEALAGLTDVVPFLVEDELQKNGGKYSKGADGKSYSVRDGNLITGQNPASSEAVAKAVLEQLT